MLDIKFIKENKDIIKEAARKKHLSFNVNELLKVEEARLALLQEVEALRAKQNEKTDEIGKMSDLTYRTKMIEEIKPIKENLKDKEEKLNEIMKEWRILMLQVPNVPDMTVPEGVSEEENQEVRKWGEPTRVDFVSRDHIELMERLDMVDFERGSKVAGFRGYFLKNDGALLSFAIWQYFLDRFVAKGFVPMVVPSIVYKESLFGTGFLPQGEEDLYKAQDEMYLAGTGEVATMGYYMNEIIDKKRLPSKFISFSPCFRREAGAHGKDIKGLIRVHEFFKLEQVILCEASHEESVKYHEELVANAEEALKELGLPYQVVINCGGDLGLGQVKKYDINVWTPSQGKYRETHSASYFHDFQTRRLNIRYKDSDGKMKYAHSLNNTAIATPRVISLIVENFQQKDGSIVIPEVLRKYMGGREKIVASN